MQQIYGFDRGSARTMLEAVFHNVIRNRQRMAAPSWPGIVTWEHRTREEGAPVKGWGLKRQESTGTVILTHGFTGHCMLPWLTEAAARFHSRYAISVIGVDLRFHGLSHNGIPSFGAAEMRDITAALDWAQQHGYPQPYILYGESLGAMAAARAAISDERVRAAFLKSPPGSPWQAIKANIGGMFGGAELINLVYGFDILRDGDIRAHSGSPSHRPLICYLIGDRDYYDIEETRRAYRHWYGDNLGVFDSIPGKNRTERKWFITAYGAGHIIHQYNFAAYYTVMDRFLECALDDDID